MSSFKRLYRRSGLLLGLLLAGGAVPSIAHADAALDLVRSVAAEPSPGEPTVAPRGAKRRTLRAARARKPARARFARASRPTPQLRLTAEQRGSGQVDVLEVSDDPAPESPLPSIERKSEGLALRLIATRGRR